MNRSRARVSSRAKSRSSRASSAISAASSLDPLAAVSSVDGRYRSVSESLAEQLSEYALIKRRVVVECAYLAALADMRGLGLRALKPQEKKLLGSISDISLDDARIIKAIERDGYRGVPATNHDVKAVEYFIKMKLEGTTLEDVSEWVHFALTSEDVNSVAHALCLRDAIEQVIAPALDEVHAALASIAKQQAATPMLARTHGQPATPTTYGKEVKVFAERLRRQRGTLRKNPILVKWGGATGNYSAHSVAAPSVDWVAFARRFVAGLNTAGGAHTVRLELNETTTQIEPHDTLAEMFDAMRRINTILIDLSQDMWRYISDGWVIQRPKEGEIGSSAMPHKVNPIDFENAEGNLGAANALFEFFSRKLPVSRLQRDLSDSTVERVFGTAFAHALIGYRALMRGFSKIAPNPAAMLEALRAHPEVLAEAIQTVLRAEGVEAPYEKLKQLTRGKSITQDDLAAFVDALDISQGAKARLTKLRPETYIGIAAKMAR